MYHFIVVDDEYFVRQRIKLCIPWNEYGFECAGEAANVEQALQLLLTAAIDLVILDISMPGANGMELLRIMKEKESSVTFIILSGFATFEYAKQAIEYHVMNYLLKPINREELIRTIIQVKQSLDKRSHRKQEQIAYQEARLVAQSMGRNTFFQYVLSGHPLDPGNDQLTEYGICSEIPYTVIVFDGLPRILHKLSFQERTAFQSALGNLAINLLAGRGDCIHLTDIYDHQVIILPDQQLSNGPDQFLCFLSDAVRNSFSRDIICSYSLATDGLAASIASAYQTAMQFFTFRTIYGMDAGEFHTQLPEKQALELISRLKKTLNHGLIQKNQQIVLNSIRSVFQIIRQDTFSLPALESALSVLLTLAIEYAVHHEIELFRTSWVPLYTATEILYKGYSIGEIEEKFSNLFLSLLSSQDMDDTPMIEKIVLQAVELIEREYSNTDLGLQYIASILLISPAYLSRNFKRIKQYSIMQYLTKCRMEHAWDLLSHTDLSIASVAEKTGYQDSFYFSKCFKRYFGFSPSHVMR